MIEKHVADFVIAGWGAWAPGLRCREDWRQWLQGHKIINDDPPPAPNSVAKSLLRRLSPLAKAAFTAIEQCVGEDETMPAVFSSSHGEIVKSFGMLESLQAGEELSPTAFSLSVHNAIAGLYSMAYGNHSEISVIAPGKEGMAAGFIEALGLLQEGHPQALLVFYDEPLPTFYPVEPFNLDSRFPCALALKLVAAGEGMPLKFGHAAVPRHDGEQPLQLPAFIKFLVSEDRLLQLGNGDKSWQWLKT